MMEHKASLSGLYVIALLALSMGCHSHTPTPRSQKSAVQSDAEAGAVEPLTPKAGLTGARAVLREVSQALIDTETPAQDDDDSVLLFLNQIDGFFTRSTSLTPENAAAEWIALFHKANRFTERTSNREQFWEMQESAYVRGLTERLFKQLPGPETWPFILAHFEEKKTPASPQEEILNLEMRTIFYFLTEQFTLSENALDDLEKTLNQSAHSAYPRNPDNPLAKAKSVFSDKTATSDGMLTTFRKSLEEAMTQKNAETHISVPDLLTLTDKKTTKELLLKVIRIPNVSVSIPNGGETKALLKTLILTHFDQLKSPIWGLVDSTDDVALYEKLLNRFRNEMPGKENEQPLSQFIRSTPDYRLSAHNYEWHRARSYYIAGLVLSDRPDEAFKLFQESRDATTGQPQPLIAYDARDMDSFVKRQKMYRFLTKLVSDAPDGQIVQKFTALSIRTGKAQQAIDILTQTLLKTDITFAQQMHCRESLGRLLLATDQLDAAREQMYLTIQQQISPLDAGQKDGLSFSARQGIAHMYEIGRLLDNDSFKKTAISQGEAFFKANPESSQYESNTTCSWYMETEQYARCEACLLARMKGAVRAYKDAPQQQFKLPLLNLQAHLAMLLTLYVKLDAYDDAKALLHSAPWWAATDILAFSYDYSVLLSVAKTLWKTGDPITAQKILKYAIQLSPQDDRAYAIFAEIAGKEAFPFFEKLRLQWPFEERPLIWKAQIHHDLNQNEEALATIEKAIHIDPTDGEQRNGQRVHAYEVWADILERSDKEEQAMDIRNIVASVRVAEEGDKLRELGLYQRSLEKYQKAETLFKDAYCVQWRLAETLHALGNTEEALQHYRIVFEKMPYQFGKMASFCFGCEGVFEKKRSLDIADEVIASAINGPNVRPQHYYLLGLLRLAQERNKDAYDAFRQALEMDPDYIDALEEMNDLNDELYLDPKESTWIRENIFRLRPMAYENVEYFAQSKAPKQVWAKYETLQKLIEPLPESLYPLKSSVAEIKSKDHGQKILAIIQRGERDRAAESMAYRFSTPQNVLLQHTLVSNIFRMMQNPGYW